MEGEMNRKARRRNESLARNGGKRLGTGEAAFGAEGRSICISMSDEMIEIVSNWKHGPKAQWTFNDKGEPEHVQLSEAAKEDPGMILLDDGKRKFFQIPFPWGWNVDVDE
jgi:hypothetical protein